MLPDCSPYKTPPVHPRACGEHLLYILDVSGQVGSSPRLRGTSSRQIDMYNIRRFIPAPAGNITESPIALILPTVHPRACGEHLLCQRIFNAFNGSSPRLRGTYYRQFFRSPSLRFIPAPAGNMLRVRLAASRLPVHPRACGEHICT